MKVISMRNLIVYDILSSVNLWQCLRIKITVSSSNPDLFNVFRSITTPCNRELKSKISFTIRLGHTRIVYCYKITIIICYQDSTSQERTCHCRWYIIIRTFSRLSLVASKQSRVISIYIPSFYF